MTLQPIAIAPRSLDRFREVLGDEFSELEEATERGRRLFAGRVVWHLNSTARGGGVVELLSSLLAYARGAGVDNRWYAIAGTPEFFELTKRIHNNLHGAPGDGGELGPTEHELYERTLAADATEIRSLVRAGDVVFLHDPQTAGLVDAVRETGARVVWRCHVGLDLPNDIARRAWDFLRPYVEAADAYVFSRREFAWEGIGKDRVWIVHPSIDVFAPKNQEMHASTVEAILEATGIAVPAVDGVPVFERGDCSPGRVDHRADLHGTPPVPGGATVVTQVSRWDRLKDPAGVLRSFPDWSDADGHLVLAGPAAGTVADDPEAAAVLADVIAQREALEPGVRERAHLASLPMDDVEENAAIVNALQRRSQVVVQKSIAEGFGLTVAEAMWKSRPVVASACGGIQDQIVDGQSGILIGEANDLEAFSRAVSRLLADPAEAARMGAAARDRVREKFLGSRHLVYYLELLEQLLDGD
jgi:trehalose synthase